MNEVIALAVKDLRVLLRDRSGFFFVFFFPLIMAIFFGSIFSGEGGGGEGIGVYVVDEDNSENSRKFIARLEEAPELSVTLSTREEAAGRVRRGRTTAYLIVLEGFGERWNNMLVGDPPEIELALIRQKSRSFEAICEPHEREFVSSDRRKA